MKTLRNVIWVACLLQIQFSVQQNALAIYMLSTVLSDSASASYDWISTVWDSCPFVDDIADALKASLPRMIRGQQGAVDSIVNAVSAWEFMKQSGMSEPLVLAIVGPTGVGKSETAYRIADAIFAKKTRVGNSRKHIPNGLLVLRGEDFSAESEAAIIGMGEIHRRIRSRVVDHLSKCSGNALIVVDEVQKVAPGALEALMPGLRERGSFSTTVTSLNVFMKPVETYKELSTSNAIFIFISDIASEKIESQVLYYGDRSKIPQNALRSAVKGSLDEQWSRLNFGKTIKEVIPFLPMEKAQIEEVFLVKFSEMARGNRRIFWLDLVIDRAVVSFLTGPEFIRYRQLTQSFPMPKPLNETHESNRTNPVSNPGSYSGSNSGSGSGSEQVMVARTKIFATMGARSLENAGPIHDLNSLLFRNMRPWQADKILHITLTDTTKQRKRQRRQISDSAANKKQASVDINGNLVGDSTNSVLESHGDGGKAVSDSRDGRDGRDGRAEQSNKRSQRPQVSFQWCSLTERIKFSEEDQTYIIDADTSNSDSCETIWFGDFNR